MLLHFALACVAAPLGTGVPLHDFEDISVWSPNKDGGHAPEISADSEFARDGQALRLRYTDRAPHWGNLRGPCRVPGEALALKFWVYPHTATGNAALHIWLLEPDNDAWAQRVRFGAPELAELKPGWYEVRLPVSGFSFEPRGQKTRQMTSVDRMLIGCNFADLEVTVDSMAWETDPVMQALPPAKTDGLTVERGERGSVGVLDMGDGLPDGFAAAHPPAALAGALRGGGFGATILQAGDLADAELVTPQNFDAVVLPFGPYFPQEARETFLAYLRAGGSFLSTDGYAFDQLVVLTKEGWTTLPADRTAAEMDEPEEQQPPFGMNTRRGKAGDAVSLHPSQIGVFDPQFHLEHATRLRPAPWLGRSPTYSFSEPVTGFSACALTGVNGAVFPPVYRRWIPVLEAFDEAGGIRGTALSIVHNFADEYAGSSWAFSGITSGEDVFLSNPKRRGLLCRVVADITEKVFLHSLTTDLALYESGETAHISVEVSNHGRGFVEREFSLHVGDREVLAEALRIGSGRTRTLEADVPVDECKSDIVALRATLRDADRLADVVESAFCIRDENVMASGPEIGWADNYMTVDGRPSFLIGTNQTGMMYFSADEGPAAWDRDFRAMAEHGFHIWRILHFSPFSAGGYEGRPTNKPLDLVNRPQRLIRQMDAIVQLAQKHRVAFFLSLHDWMGTVLTDEELTAQADWNRFWAGRYRDVPGIFYDIQNEPSVAAADRPDIVALWNEFLQERYGSDEALRAAWSKNSPEDSLPDVPLGDITNEWNDVRAADRKRFETELLNRWVKANVDGIRAGDPDALVCVGYLPSMPPADKILGVKHTDFSNMHYYGPVDRFPLEVKIIDRRFQGKGFSVGEFGAREAHDARTHGRMDVPVEQSIHRFQTYIHYAAALGAAFIANWDWKEFDQAIFPWGLHQRGSYVTKPWLHTLEQGALLLSLAEPAYESPDVFIVAPDSHRIGPRFNELHGALTRSVELLLDQRVNFGVVNEEDIADLPASAKALVWPVPYCPADETFEQILAWVKAGGALYVSGDLSFDRTRKPTRADRRGRLGLPDAPATNPFATPDDAWQAEPIETPVGQGKVLFVPYPLELKRRPTDEGVYRRFISLARLSPIEIEPADGPVRVLSIPVREGGRLYMLARRDDGEELLSITLPAHNVSVDLAPKGYSFILTGAAGQVTAAESQGAIRIGGDLVARSDEHFGVGALDGEDLRASGSIVVLPHQAASVEVRVGPAVEDAECYVGSPDGTRGTTGAFDGTIDFSDGAPGRVAVVASAGDMEMALRRLRGRLARRSF